MLEITKQRDGSKLTISLEGRIDSMTAAKLEESLAGELNGIDEIVLDVAGVSYVSSAGLRVLLGTRKATSNIASFETVNASEEVRDIFDVTHMMELLNVK